MEPIQTTVQPRPEGGWSCQTQFRLPPRRLGALRLGKPRDYRFEFIVAPSGVVRFDNRQAQARACGSRRAGGLLAAEICRVATRQVPGALTGRSPRGLRWELGVHYRFHQLGVLRRHATVTDMGGTEAQGPDYDGNAVCFEHPSKSLGPILRELKKRLRRK